MGSIGSTIDFSPYRNVGTIATENSDINLKSIIESAKNAGYDFVDRLWDKRGNSGQLYEQRDRYFLTPVRNDKISGNSAVMKHLKNTQNQYSDVIILQSSPALRTSSRTRRGDYIQKVEAEFVVMARKKRRR